MMPTDEQVQAFYDDLFEGIDYQEIYLRMAKEFFTYGEVTAPACVYDDGGLTYPPWCYTHDQAFPHE